METITQKYKIRYSSTVDSEMHPLCEDIQSALSSESGDSDLRTHGLAEFVLAKPRIVIRREFNPTFEVELSIEGVHAFAREVAYRVDFVRDIRRDEPSEYRFLTSVLKQLETALKGANKVLEGAGFKPVHSYWNTKDGVLIPA